MSRFYRLALAAAFLAPVGCDSNPGGPSAPDPSSVPAGPAVAPAAKTPPMPGKGKSKVPSTPPPAAGAAD